MIVRNDQTAAVDDNPSAHAVDFLSCCNSVGPCVCQSLVALDVDNGRFSFLKSLCFMLDWIWSVESDG